MCTLLHELQGVENQNQFLVARNKEPERILQNILKRFFLRTNFLGQKNVHLNRSGTEAIYLLLNTHHTHTHTHTQQVRQH